MKQLYVKHYMKRYGSYQPQYFSRYKNSSGITLFIKGTYTTFSEALEQYFKTKQSYVKDKNNDYTVTLTEEEYKVFTHLPETSVMDKRKVYSDYLQKKLSNNEFFDKLRTHILLELLHKQPNDQI